MNLLSPPFVRSLGALACVALASCMSAAPPVGMPDVDAIGLSPDAFAHAVPPQCASLDERSGMRDAGYARPGIAFGCATYTNLAAMLARPADLSTPRPYAGADAPLAASAVRRYEEGRTTPLSGWSASGSTGGSSN